MAGWALAVPAATPQQCQLFPFPLRRRRDPTLDLSAHLFARLRLVRGKRSRNYRVGHCTDRRLPAFQGAVARLLNDALRIIRRRLNFRTRLQRFRHAIPYELAKQWQPGL